MNDTIKWGPKIRAKPLEGASKQPAKGAVETVKDVAATLIARAMSSKVGCAGCQGARRKVGAKVLKAIGR